MDLNELICINATDRHSGVGNYVLMIEDLLGRGKVATLVLDKRKKDWDYPGTVYNGFFPPVTSGWWLNTTFYPQVFKLKGLEIPDFIHMLDITALVPTRKQRGIVTVHDLYHNRRSYGANPEGRKFMDKQVKLLLTWDYVLADSYATVEELMKVGFTEEQITVIHLSLRDGIWFKMGEEEKKEAALEHFPELLEVKKPIVLTVGDAKHKNNALTHEAAKGKYFHVHVGNDVKADLNLYHVPDETLRLLFNLSSVYVRPTDFEGFGLPAVESLMCGTPAVVSDIPVYHETLGESGVYATINKESVSSQIRYAMENKDELIKVFNSNYREHYSINRFNREMMDYYRSARN